MRRPVSLFPSILLFLLFAGVHGREPVQYQISHHDSSIKDTCSYMAAPLSHMLRSIPGLNSSSTSGRDDTMQGCMCTSSVRKYLASSGNNTDEMDVKTLERSMEAFIVESPGAKHCSYPPHATAQCTQDDPCGFSCTDGFQLSSFDFRGKKTTACTCPAPNSICDGQCGDYPGGCPSKTTKDNFRLHKEVVARSSYPPAARSLVGRSPRPSARAIRRQTQPSAGPSPQPSAAFQSYTPVPTNSFSSAQAQQAQDAGCEPNETLCGAYAPRGRRTTECVDTQNSLESCGGCMVDPPSPFISYDSDYDEGYSKRQTPKGVDCSNLDGVSDVSCSMGRCDVQSCESGWKVAPSGDHCVPESSGGDTGTSKEDDIPASTSAPQSPPSTTSSVASPTPGPEPTTTDAAYAPSPSSQSSDAQSGANEQSNTDSASSDTDSGSAPNGADSDSDTDGTNGANAGDTNSSGTSGNGNGVDNGTLIPTADISTSCEGDNSAAVNITLCWNITMNGGLSDTNGSASSSGVSRAGLNVTDVQEGTPTIGASVDTLDGSGIDPNLGGVDTGVPLEGANVQNGDVNLPTRASTGSSSLGTDSLPKQDGISDTGTTDSDNTPDSTDTGTSVFS